MSSIPTLLVYVLAGLTALAGLAAILIGMLAGRSGGRRRCPGCWYDLPDAVLPVRCPECGRAITLERELARTRRRWWLATLGALLVLPLVAFVGVRHGEDLYYAVMPKWKVIESCRWGTTTAVRSTIRDPRRRGMRAVVASGGRRVLDVEDVDIQFGQRDWSAPAGTSAHQLGCADDLNADGTPELVVFAYSGGAHCCYTISVLELSDPPRVVRTFDAQNGMGIKPSASRQGEYDLDIPDQTFDYWNAPHVSSPMPSVLYRLEDHELVLDLEEMRRPAPEPGALEAEAARVRGRLAAPGAALEPDLWRIMLDLIYTGNEALSRGFFEAAWPAERPGRDEFYAEFRKVLESSPHYRNLRVALAGATGAARRAELPGSENGGR